VPFDTKKKQKNRLMGAEAIWIDFSTFLIKCFLLEIHYSQTKKIQIRPIQKHTPQKRQNISFQNAIVLLGKMLNS
jgi:hypothetical protein